MIYVLYHSNCYDGFGAAFSVWKKLGDAGVKYIPVTYGTEPPDMPDAAKVFIVDFSYQRDVMVEMISQSTAHDFDIVVLDHHKTAEANLKDLAVKNGSEIIFDMNRSGALITWEYFHGVGTAPPLIQHISDRDLWTFNMPGSKEIHSALVSYPFDFKVWDSFNIEGLIAEGITCERFEKSVVANICKNQWIGPVDDYQVPIVNTTQSWSEVGHELLERNPDAPFVASFTIFKDQIMWSLRSRKGFDVSAIAKKYGGGGHAQAAGFKAVRP